MGKLLKIIGSIIATLVLLIIITVGVLPFVIDPNDFKPEIVAVVKENTGRTLTISGNLELSIFPWIGLSTGKLSLSNAANFSEQAFAEIAESDIKVKLIPLLSKEVEVSRIVLQGLSLNLEKNQQGIGNWEDLSADSEAEDEDSALPALAALAIGGLELEDGQIIWDDQQTGKHVEIREINLQTDRLAFNAPIAVALAFNVLNDQPAITEQVQFATNVVINEALDQIELRKVNLESTTIGEAIPGGELTAQLTTDIALDRNQQIVTLTGLEIRSGEVQLKAEISGKNLDSKPLFSGPIALSEFNPRKLMQQLQITVPPMQDDSAFRHLTVRFDLKADADTANFENIQLKLDDSSLQGNIQVSNFSQPVLTFVLDIDSINADRYLAESTTTPKAAEHHQPVATPSTVVAAGTDLFPVQTLRELNANGTLTIGKLIVNKLHLQGVSLKLNADHGVIKSRQSVKQFYQGNYAGIINIDVRNERPLLTMNENLSKVSLDPLLKDLQGEASMTGTVSANAKLRAKGNSSVALKASLNGNMNFNFSDGVIKGFNLQKIIDNTKAIYQGSSSPLTDKNDQTEYTEITASVNINNGLAINDDLYAKSSVLRVTGKGSANLASEKLDYKVTAKWVREEATTTEPEKIEGVPLVIDIGGTFTEPSYIPNIQEMVPEKTKQKLYNKIDKELGPGVSDLLKQFLK